MAKRTERPKNDIDKRFENIRSEKKGELEEQWEILKKSKESSGSSLLPNINSARDALSEVGALNTILDIVNGGAVKPDQTTLGTIQLGQVVDSCDTYLAEENGLDLVLNDLEEACQEALIEQEKGLAEKHKSQSEEELLELMARVYERGDATIEAISNEFTETLYGLSEFNVLDPNSKEIVKNRLDAEIAKAKEAQGKLSKTTLAISSNKSAFSMCLGMIVGFSAIAMAAGLVSLAVPFAATAAFVATSITAAITTGVVAYKKLKKLDGTEGVEKAMADIREKLAEYKGLNIEAKKSYVDKLREQRAKKNINKGTHR